MLTRGYFIGEIIDSFSDVAARVATRGRLGLNDLSKHAEEFFKVTLNYLLDSSLVNLNDERSNAPGLDLGDEHAGIAFQVTAEKTSAKVNDMLAKLSTEQIAIYPKTRVLIIGHRQSSYTLNESDCARAGFTEDDIWDIDTLCKRSMDLKLDVLQSLYNHVRSELTRVRIDLEIPDIDGNYPTNIASYIEAIPKPRMSDLSKYNRFLKDAGWDEEAIEDTPKTFAAFSAHLAKLPRITREFLAMMIERRETRDFERIEINADKLQRISRYPDQQGELRVLETYGFTWCDEPDQPGESYHWRIIFPGTPSRFKIAFLDYLDRYNVPLNRPLVSLDFSAF